MKTRDIEWISERTLIKVLAMDRMPDLEIFLFSGRVRTKVEDQCNMRGRPVPTTMIHLEDFFAEGRRLFDQPDKAQAAAAS